MANNFVPYPVRWSADLWTPCTALTLYFLLIFLASCNTSVDNHNHSMDSISYTCPMHPQVIQSKPGRCPVCGMDLVKTEKTSASITDGLMLSDAQIKLANIRVAKVRMNVIGEALTLNGRLTMDESETKVLSSRAAGRIEKLFIKETGVPIKKGEPLYILYSENLLTLQKEYMLAKEQFEAFGKTEKRYKSFLEASEKKLLLYGLTKSQIQKLHQSSLEPRITFLSETSGIITEVNASEGQYISEGSSLYKIDNIGKLWVEAELYAGEATLVKPGDKITVRLNGESDNPLEATVFFLSPENRKNSQVTILRASVNNEDAALKPGQHATVFLQRSSKKSISIPVEAIIHHGKEKHVYVQSGQNTFQPRLVETGIETANQVEITDGLVEGDTVAVSGAYLLYSEFVLKNGSNPIIAQDHRH